MLRAGKKKKTDDKRRKKLKELIHIFELYWGNKIMQENFKRRALLQCCRILVYNPLSSSPFSGIESHIIPT